MPGNGCVVPSSAWSRAAPPQTARTPARMTLTARLDMIHPQPVVSRGFALQHTHSKSVNQQMTLAGRVHRDTLSFRNDGHHGCEVRSLLSLVVKHGHRDCLFRGVPI